MAESAAGQIGRYRLLEIIGEGGFGTVWMAEQTEPVRRRVALKIIKLGMDTRQVVARFLAERQALALMDHPNIAKVLDAGTTGSEANESHIASRTSQIPTGRPYFVMELVRGVPITEYCDTRRLDLRERLELLIPVCRAVQHAHQKGVIHRDLKPSNLLVTEQDGRAVPKIIDFGVAKAIGEPLTDQTLFTRFHQFLGTPAYMSPEQAGLGGLDIDTRSDIYSLGVLLYQLLTGRTPFEARELARQGHERLLQTIREQDPPRPSTRLSALKREDLLTIAAERCEDPQRLLKVIRGDLEWIVLKSLEKDRARRYESANGLAADLRRYLDNEPTTAAPPSLAYQFGKFASRNRTALATATAFLVVLVGAAVISAWQAVRATQLAKSESELRRVAEKAQAAAEASQEEQRRVIYASEMGLAYEAWASGQAPQTRRLLEQQRRQPGKPELRGWEWRYLWGQSRPQELAVITNLPTLASGSAWSRDGRLALGFDSGGVQVFDPAEHRRLGERWLTNAYIVDMLEFTPDGTGLYISTRNTNFFLLDSVTLETREVFAGHTQGVCGLRLGRNGQRLVSAGGHPYGQVGMAEVFVWDTSSRQITFRLPPHEATAIVPDLSTSGRFLAVPFSWSRRVEVWDLQAERLVSEFTAHRDRVWATSFSPDETRLATCGEDGYVRLWDWRTGREIATLGAHRAPCLWVEFSPDGTRLLSCGLDSALRIWDPAALQERATLRGHMGRLMRARFSPDGTQIASACLDFSLRLWDGSASDARPTVARFPQSRAQGEFSPDGQFTVVAWGGGPVPAQIRIQPTSDARSGATNSSVQLLPAALSSFAFTGSNLALVSGVRQMTIRTLADSRVVRELTSPWPLIGPLAASGDGHWLACFARSGSSHHVLVWDAASGEVAADLTTEGPPPRPGVVNSPPLLFSADGTRLWTAHPDGRDVLTYDWQTGTSATRWAGHRAGVLSAARSPDGNWLVTGGQDQVALLWDAASGELAGVMAGEAGLVNSLAFSRDGRTLAMGCFDGWVKLWNVPTRLPIATLQPHISIVFGVSFSPDGRGLLTTSYDGTARLWEAPTFDVTDAADQAVHPSDVRGAVR